MISRCLAPCRRSRGGYPPRRGDGGGDKGRRELFAATRGTRGLHGDAGNGSRIGGVSGVAGVTTNTGGHSPGAGTAERYWSLQSFRRCKQMLASRRRGWEHLRMRSQSRTSRPSSETHWLLQGSFVTHSRAIYTPSNTAAQEVAGKEAKIKFSAGARARVMITCFVATCRGNRRYCRCLAR